MNKCVAYVFCDKKDCNKFHFKNSNWEDRMLFGMVKEKIWDEISVEKEESVGRNRHCYFSLMCFERDCPHFHSGIGLEGRKKLIKECKKAKRIDGLQKEIKAIVKGESRIIWADNC